MNKVIAITLYRRPDYTETMLRSLAKCFGVEDYTILFSCDWNKDFADDCNKVIALAESWNASALQVFVNAPRLGVDENKLFVMEHAFALADFVVVLEDDIIPARDFLLYMEYFSKWGRDTAGILSVCGYNRHLDLDESKLYTVWADKGFHTWGWGMWRDRWERFFGDGAKSYRLWAGDKVNGLFDHYLTAMAKESNLYTIKPCVARAQNIGLERGEHSTAETYKQDHNPRGAWELDLNPYAGDWNYESLHETDFYTPFRTRPAG